MKQSTFDTQLVLFAFCLQIVRNISLLWIFRTNCVIYFILWIFVIHKIIRVCCKLWIITLIVTIICTMNFAIAKLLSFMQNIFIKCFFHEKIAAMQNAGKKLSLLHFVLLTIYTYLIKTGLFAQWILLCWRNCFVSCTLGMSTVLQCFCEKIIAIAKMRQKED